MVSLLKVLTNNVIIYSLHSIWHVYQVPSQSVLISLATSFWMANKPFKVEKKHTSNQVHYLHLQNDSPFYGLLCYYLQTWAEPLFLSSSFQELFWWPQLFPPFKRNPPYLECTKNSTFGLLSII